MYNYVGLPLVQPLSHTGSHLIHWKDKITDYSSFKSMRTILGQLPSTPSASIKYPPITFRLLFNTIVRI